MECHGECKCPTGQYQSGDETKDANSSKTLPLVSHQPISSHITIVATGEKIRFSKIHPGEAQVLLMSVITSEGEKNCVGRQSVSL